MTYLKLKFVFPLGNSLDQFCIPQELLILCVLVCAFTFRRPFSETFDVKKVTRPTWQYLTREPSILFNNFQFTIFLYKVKNPI